MAQELFERVDRGNSVPGTMKHKVCDEPLIIESMNTSKDILWIAVLAMVMAMASVTMTSCSKGDNPTEELSDDFYDMTLPPGGGFEANVKLNEGDGDIYLHNRDTVTGTGGNETRLNINGGDTVTFYNVDITHLRVGTVVTCHGDCTIILAGENQLKGAGIYPAMFVKEQGTLTITGDGQLTVEGSSFATAIGSGPVGSFNRCGNIVIEGGVIIARTGSGAFGSGENGRGVPAIGSSRSGSCGNITIRGGSVMATASRGAPAIGSAEDRNSSCGDIVITEGITSVSLNRDSHGFYIGTGNYGSCGSVTIDGVKLTDEQLDDPEEIESSVFTHLNSSLVYHIWTLTPKPTE